MLDTTCSGRIFAAKLSKGLVLLLFHVKDPI